MVHGTCRVVPGTAWHVPRTAWHLVLHLALLLALLWALLRSWRARAPANVSVASAIYTISGNVHPLASRETLTNRDRRRSAEVK